MSQICILWRFIVATGIIQNALGGVYVKILPMRVTLYHIYISHNPIIIPIIFPIIFPIKIPIKVFIKIPIKIPIKNPIKNLI